MRARLVALAALVVAAVALWVALRSGADTPAAEVGGSVVGTEALAPRVDRLAERGPEPVVEAGEVRSNGAQGSRDERVAAEEAQAALGRANRQRLLFSNLTGLSAAAERAEREGKPEHAAALRHRAEILARGVRME